MENDTVVPRLYCNAPMPGPHSFTLGNDYEIVASYTCDGVDILLVTDDEGVEVIFDATGWFISMHFELLGDYKDVWEGEYE